MSSDPTFISIETSLQVPIEHAWHFYVLPEHITHWNHASPEWHCPQAISDLKPGGHFSYRMEAKDGSFGFDFGGVFDEVIPNERIMYTIGDGRKVTVLFASFGDRTRVTIHFEAETQNPVDLQQGGWQAILDSYRTHAEKSQ